MASSRRLPVEFALRFDARILRKRVETHISRGEADGSDGLHPTPRLLKVINLAAKESERRTTYHVGAEHLLLALLEEHNGLAAEALRESDITSQSLRKAIEEVMHG